jgi:hypothetical protein
MSELYEKIIAKSYDTCKRLENIVLGIVEKLEDEQYVKSAPMSKQLTLINKATAVLVSIMELSQVLKSEGLDATPKQAPPDPRIPELIEKIRKLQQQN